MGLHGSCNLIGRVPGIDSIVNESIEPVYLCDSFFLDVLVEFP